MFRNLSVALKTEPGDEFVISKLDHEANIASWVQLAEWKGLTVKWWVPSKDTSSNPKLVPEDLKKLLSPKTRLVTCTHTSNILGSITDIAPLAEVIHATSPRALFCVDAVAYAPHASIDVKALGVDFYSFSWYKVYGPHISMLYVKKFGRIVCIMRSSLTSTLVDPYEMMARRKTLTRTQVTLVEMAIGFGPY